MSGTRVRRLYYNMYSDIKWIIQGTKFCFVTQRFLLCMVFRKGITIVGLYAPFLCKIFSTFIPLVT